MFNFRVGNAKNPNVNPQAETNNHAANGLTTTFKCIIDLLKKPFSNAYKFMSGNIQRPNSISSISNNSAIGNVDGDTSSIIERSKLNDSNEENPLSENISIEEALSMNKEEFERYEALM